MSGRTLGRLLGSLLVLAVVAGGLFGVDLGDAGGEARLADVVWGAGTFR